MGNKKYLLYYALIAIIMLVVLNQINNVNMEYMKILDSHGSSWDREMLPVLLKISFLSFLFGLLMEYNGIKKIVKKEIEINKLLLIITLIILVSSFIPVYYWMKWQGYLLIIPYEIFYKVLTWPLQPLRYLETQALLNVLSGVLLVRSLTNKQ
ncbi:MAG: hypothetical protein K9L56_13025 [Clostridiales bacterium]|nr:hypothetical protein [Clostridiales bacterium]